MVVSEIHGDPKYLSDSEGEYLELFHADSLPYTSDSLVLILGTDDTLPLPGDWEAYQIFLLCRDSTAMAVHGFTCHREWSSLSLANSREVILALRDSSQVLEFSVPPPLSGASWENVLDGSPSNHFVKAVQSKTVHHDKGSPGEMSSQNAFVFSKDVVLERVAVTWDSAGPPAFTLEVAQRGRNALDRATLKVTVDRDWDGNPDLTLDTLSVDLPPSAGTLSYRPTTSFEGFYHFLMEGDHNPGNNSATFSLFADVPLKLSEVCPDPPEGTPEWIEVYNTSGKALSLRYLTLNGNVMEAQWDEDRQEAESAFLQPYSYAILAENAEKFQAAYSGYQGKLWELEKWATLKNTGDTVRMAWGGQFPLDSMSYGKLSGVEKNSCWERSEPDGQWVAVAPEGINPGTPGDSTGQAPGLRWEVASKIINTERNGSAAQITIEAPLNIQYALHVYSLNGEEVARLCGPCRGSRELKWNGRSSEGKALPLGPYILALKPEGRSVRKKTVVLARPL